MATVYNILPKEPSCNSFDNIIHARASGVVSSVETAKDGGFWFGMGLLQIRVAEGSPPKWLVVGANVEVDFESVTILLKDFHKQM